MHDQMSENYCVKCVIRCGLGCGHHYGDECAETEKPVSDIIVIDRMEQVDILAKQLRCPPPVIAKAKEYFRLSHLKYKGLTHFSLAAICLELSCHQSGEAVDKKRFQRFSGLQTKQYLNLYHNIEKILKIQSRTTLRDIALRIGLPELEAPAGQILRSYQDHLKSKHGSARYEAIDFSSSLYTAAAILTASKLVKMKCDKSKVLAISSTNMRIFKNVTEEMQEAAASIVHDLSDKKWTGKDTVEGKDDQVESITKNPDTIECIRAQSFQERCVSNPKRQEYIEWKEKMLKTL